GVWSIGRLVEQFYGSARYLIIYVLAGLAGSFASVATGADATHLSVGASGALFGLVGAAIAEMGGRRSGAPAQPGDGFRRALLANLLFIAVLNVGIGFWSARIDQAAHIAGGVAGWAFGLALRRRGRAARGDLAARAGAAACGAAIVVAAVLAATTSLSTTLDRIGWETRALGDVRIDLPHGLRLDPPFADHVPPRLTVTAQRADAIGEQLLRDNLSRRKGVEDVVAAPAMDVRGMRGAAFRFGTEEGERLELSFWRDIDGGALRVSVEVAPIDRA